MLMHFKEVYKSVRVDDLTEKNVDALYEVFVECNQSENFERGEDWWEIKFNIEMLWKGFKGMKEPNKSMSQYYDIMAMMRTCYKGIDALLLSVFRENGMGVETDFPF